MQDFKRPYLFLSFPRLLSFSVRHLKARRIAAAIRALRAATTRNRRDAGHAEYYRFSGSRHAHSRADIAPGSHYASIFFHAEPH